MNRLLWALAATCVVTSAAAQSSPAGLWKTIDDVSKKELSQIRINESNGIFTGHIEKLLKAAEAGPNLVCKPCSDDRKDKPIVGLEIIRGVEKNADTDALWDGGTILDPVNGKTYKLRLKMAESGKELEVRGYIGAPMFGRSQTWYRVE